MAKTAETKSEPFLTDVKTLRERGTQKHRHGEHHGPPIKAIHKKTIDILQTVARHRDRLRSPLHHARPWRPRVISSEGVKKEFQEHADEESEHMHSVAERINQLGGTPDFDPKGLENARAASEYGFRADVG